MLDISPFVSKTVLTDVANRTDVFPHPVALEIFIANPNVLRDSRFIDYLADKANPMPEYMIELLLEAADEETFRTTVQQNLDAKVAAHTAACWMLMEAAAYEDDREYMRYLLERTESLYNEYKLAEMDLEDGQPQAAFDRLAIVHEHIRIDEYAQYDLEQYTAWLNFKLTEWNDSTEWAGLDSLQLVFVYDMADHYYTRAGAEAMNVLNTFYNEHYFVPPALGQDWTPRFAKPKHQNRDKPTVSVYPNPANTWVTFELNRSFEG